MVFIPYGHFSDALVLENKYFLRHECLEWKPLGIETVQRNDTSEYQPVPPGVIPASISLNW